MAITRQKKEEVLKGLVDKFTRSKSVIFTQYRGLDVAGISDLRRKLREKGAECKVAKKTLMKLAAKEADIGEIADELLEGPVSATFCFEDALSGLKVLFQFSKDNENIKLIGGIVDGRMVNADEVNQLAKLPSKEELMAKLLGSMNAPVSGMVGIMSNLMSGLVRVLDSYKDTLPADSSPAPIDEPKKAEAELAKEEEIKEIETEPPSAEATDGMPEQSESEPSETEETSQ